MSNPFDKAAEAFEEKVAAKAAAPAARVDQEPEEADEPPFRVPGPGEYDIRAEQYHADPCPEPSLSGSLIKVLMERTPRHARALHPRLNPTLEPKERTLWDNGSVFHKLILGQGAEVVAYDAKDWTVAGNAGRAFKEQARKAHKIPILLPKLREIERMVAEVRAQMRHKQELAYAMAGGVAERTLVWVEETPYGPIYCRCMLDWIPNQGSLMPDWKSTTVGAGPDEWGAKTLWQVGGDIQAAWNRRALKAVTGRELDLFFAVAEMEEPYCLSIMRPDPAAVAVADRKIQFAINGWAACLATGRFPGYPDEMAWIECPPWKEKPFLEREARGDFDNGFRLSEYVIAQAGEPTPKEIEPDDGVERDAFGLAPIEKDPEQ